MKLKIISDGTPSGTKVVNAETGEELKYLESVKWSVSVGQPSSAQIALDCVEFEGIGEAE